MRALKKKYIRATRAVSLINENKGKFFGITYLTKNGKENYQNVHTYSNPIQTPLGYIKVKTKNGGYKTIDPRNIKRLNIAKGEFKIRR